MDDDDTRRGRPASHRVYGEGVAILVGDTLFAEAFAHLLCRLDESPERVVEAAAILARSLGADGMAGGQYMSI